jgi:hypothetical protein
MVTDNPSMLVHVLLPLGLTVSATAMAHEVTRRPAGTEGTVPVPAGMTQRAM